MLSEIDEIEWDKLERLKKVDCGEIKVSLLPRHFGTADGKHHCRVVEVDRFDRFITVTRQ
jgi:hypothetical protein